MEKLPQAKNDEIISFQLGHSGLEVTMTEGKLSEILAKVSGKTRGLPNLTQEKIED
jgi:hypothetical protein